jgi:hypothetical protein
MPAVVVVDDAAVAVDDALVVALSVAFVVCAFIFATKTRAKTINQNIFNVRWRAFFLLIPF